MQRAAFGQRRGRIYSSLVPGTNDAFAAFSKSVFKEGALDAKTKQLMSVAVANVTQCPYCIRGHTKQALRAGATREQVMEGIWVAAEMRAGEPSRTRTSRLMR